MTTLLQILYTESQDITPTLMSQSTNLGVERIGRLCSSYPLPLDHRHGNMEVSTANWIVDQLQKVIERKYDRITWAVLGPVMFTLYTTPMQRLFRKHGVHYHKYADDIQLYAS